LDLEEEISFYGHPNITALHGMTIEITKDKNLTPRGDCIIGVNANKACYDLPDALKSRLKHENSVVKMSIMVNSKRYDFAAYGSPSLILTHKHDIVIRRSHFVCPRTLAIRCDKASNNVPKDIVRMLKEPDGKGVLLISVE
jgi:hypothetical protein